MDGWITKIQKFSVHDGPGIRTTLFLKGCPLECMWCQNPETIRAKRDVTLSHNKCVHCQKCIEVCPQHCFSQHEGELVFNSITCDQCGLCVEACPADALTWTAEKWDSNALILKVLEDKEYYDCSNGGLTLCGGEPLQQDDFCIDMARLAKEHGIHVTIDTAAYAPYSVFERILPYVDLFLYDIKFMDDAKHKKFVGKSNKLILENFEKLCKTETRIIVRIPIIPGVTDDEKNLADIEKFSNHCRPGIEITRIPFNDFMPEKYQMVGLPSYLERFGKGARGADFDTQFSLALPAAFNR